MSQGLAIAVNSEKLNSNQAPFVSSKWCKRQQKGQVHDPPYDDLKNI
ncbi:hypothetical protein [Phormidesmis priestleyi]